MCNAPAEESWDVFGRSTCGARVFEEQWAFSEIGVVGGVLLWWQGGLVLCRRWRRPRPWRR
jgi:hypothetical protein